MKIEVLPYFVLYIVDICCIFDSIYAFWTRIVEILNCCTLGKKFFFCYCSDSCLFENKTQSKGERKKTSQKICNSIQILIVNIYNSTSFPIIQISLMKSYMYFLIFLFLHGTVISYMFFKIYKIL